MELTQNELVGLSLEGEDETVMVETDEAVEDIMKALSSNTRRKILRQIQIEPADVSKIASDLDMTEANISAQIKKLEKAGLIICEYSSGAHGVRKISKLKFDRLIIKF
ncbi:MAG: ArsR family transcriptional regulator [Promethearchaeota archaeon]|nr:MAG: ArsR family transcriptional regulator [Candidatus Lokiarchaeota archaeon]